MNTIVHIHPRSHVWQDLACISVEVQIVPLRLRNRLTSRDNKSAQDVGYKVQRCCASLHLATKTQHIDDVESTRRFVDSPARAPVELGVKLVVLLRHNANDLILGVRAYSTNRDTHRTIRFWNLQLRIWTPQRGRRHIDKIPPTLLKVAHRLQKSIICLKCEAFAICVAVLSSIETSKRKYNKMLRLKIMSD